MEMAIVSGDFRIEEELWNMLPAVTEVLKLLSNKIDFLQRPNVTMSDAYGVWLELEFRLERMKDCPFAVIMLDKLVQRRDQMKIIDNEVMLSALFLDLRFNRFLSTSQKELVNKHLQYLHQKLNLKRNLQISVAVPPTEHQSDPGNDTNELEQILREMDSTRDNSQSVPSIMSDSLPEEMNAFCEIERANATTDVVADWEARKFSFSILYELAKVVLAASPTQGSVERNFSTMEFVLTKRRNRLTEENLENLLFLKLNSQLFHEVCENGEITFE